MIGFHRLHALALCGCVLLLHGCSGSDPSLPSRAAVTGKVLLDDKPLPRGVIRFVPKGETKGPKISATIEEGTFSLSGELGPIVGTHRVEIESTDTAGLAMDDEQAIDKLREQGVKKLDVVTVPPAYNRFSQLEAVIVAEKENSLEFQLDSKPQRR